ncbi:MAG TPA: hypothetical protein VGK48_17305 [Terriglobia bacterium]
MYENIHEPPLESSFAGQTRAYDEDIMIVVLLPTHDMPDVAVHIAPRQFLLAPGIDEAGLQIRQVIDLPYDVSMDGVDAEQSGNSIRITAALA